ncbi:hypothetical protein MFLAVUS_001281 [Mucor flavus]|uniref:Mediator of RNA polymerase II transcription subunit 19 n=1 Tax=Mucor flavus TaxID=439312 RepID=A0ABP9YM27_9FUNG
MTTVAKKPILTGSQDLLSYFNLIPIYNKVVKPFPAPDRAAGLDPSLFPYISDLPGRTDIEYDGYLLNLLRDPQAVETGPQIRPLDGETLKDAFSLKEGPVPGFDASVLGTDDGNGSSSNSIHYMADKNTYISNEADGERRHKKKKKKRKHEHDEDGHSHDHKKKKKKKKDRERRDESLIID